MNNRLPPKTTLTPVPGTDDAGLPASPSPATPGVGTQLSVFLEWWKPYREILVMLATLIGAISAAVTWVIAYFATQAAVSQLECKLTHQMNALRYESRATAYQGEIDSRQSQIKQLSVQKAAGTGSSIMKLMEEINDLTGKANSARDSSSDEMKLASNCPTSNNGK